jgi:hypothetical protein
MPDGLAGYHRRNYSFTPTTNLPVGFLRDLPGLFPKEGEQVEIKKQF